jgi:hypothetical protein
MKARCPGRCATTFVTSSTRPSTVSALSMSDATECPARESAARISSAFSSTPAA